MNISDIYDKIKSNFKDTKWLLVIAFFSTFILSDFIRYFIISNIIVSDIESIYSINYLFICIAVIYIYNKRKDFDYKMLLPVCLLIVVEFVNMFNGVIGINNVFLDFIFIFIPFILICIKMKELCYTDVISRIIKIINVLTIVVFILGIVDYVTNMGVQLFLNNIGFYNNIYSKHLYDIKLGNLKEPYRYLSIFGHPLRNGQLFITFYILNFIANKKFNNIKYYLCYTLIMTVGIILSNSKTAMVLAVVLAIGCYVIKYKKISIKFLGGFLILLVVLINTTMFKSTVLYRFNEAIENKDMFSGRNVIFRLISNGEVNPPKVLGSGEGYSSKLLNSTNQNIASFEYPFVIYAFDKGIVFIAIFYIILLMPLIWMVKNKKYKYIFVYIIFNIYVNIYNGIVVYGDYMTQYLIFNALLINLAKYNDEENNNM